ncbi:MAG: carbohydrate kinase family protein [Methanomassiliicoccus sp.]|nr:carbohydrate kinase family protein [Methanomassiliicoccus sp.]
MIPFLTVYGHVCLDQILALERFPEPNTSVDIREKHRYFGGTGANIATAAAALGVPTALVSYVGPDLPADFREFMESKGVDLSEVVTVEGYETSTVIVVTDSKEDQIAYVYQGPMRDMGRFEPRLDSARRSKVVHISTGRPEYYLPVMLECQRLGKEISFDPAQEIHRIWDRDTFREALPLATRLFGNRNELRTALKYMDAGGPEGLLAFVPEIITTRGKEGALAFTGQGTLSVPAAKPSAVIDPTGAGDAFRAGFYAGRYRGHGFLESMAYGNAAASFVLEAPGAVSNLPSWEMVEERAAVVLASLPG